MPKQQSRDKTDDPIRRTKFWLSQDVSGDDAGDCYLWNLKPEFEAGEYTSSSGQVGAYGCHCSEFLEFCKALEIVPPEKGELLQLNINVKVLTKVRPPHELAKALRETKGSDKSVVEEVAIWLEAK